MEQNKVSNLMTDILKKYQSYSLFMLRSKLKISRKYVAFHHIYHLLQTLTLIFRPEDHLKLPWNYSSLSIVWIGLSIVARTDYLSAYLGFSHNWIISYFIICSYLITKIILICKVEFKEFLAVLPSEKVGGVLCRKYIVYLHTYCSMILFSLQPMSILQVLLNMPDAIGGMVSNELANFVCYISLVIYLIIYLEDAIFLQKINWCVYKNYEIVSSTAYIITYRVLFVALNLSISHINFSTDSLAYSLMLVIIGAFQAYLIGFKLPYGCIYRNIMVGSEGILLLWGGVVLLITDMSGYKSQNSHFSTLLYYIPIGFLIFIYKELIQYLYNYLLNTKTFLNSTQLFHTFLALKNQKQKADLKLKFRDLRNMMHAAIINDHNNCTYLLWLTYMMILKGKFISTKVLISRLVKFKNTWLRINIEEARETYYISIQTTTSERTAFEYMLYISYYHKLLDADKRSTYYAINLYNDLLLPHQDSRILSRDMKYFYESNSHTRGLYNYMLTVFNKNPVIYEMYAGYLDVIENSPDAKEELSKAHKYKQEILRKEDSRDMDSFYMNSKNLILVVSAEPKIIGTIIDVKNSVEFGYKESELEGENLSLILPHVIYSSYIKQIQGMYDVWNTDYSIEEIEESFIWRHGGHLIPVIMRNHLINLKNGDLAAILAIKHQTQSKDISILDYEGKFMLCYTPSIANFMSYHLDCPIESLHSLNVSELMNNKSWELNDTLIEGLDISDGLHKRIVTDCKTFFGDDIKVLKLEESLSANIHKSSITYPKPNMYISSASFEIYSSGNIKPRRDSKHPSIPTCMKLFSTLIAENAEDHLNNEIHLSNISLQKDDGQASNKSENLQKYLDTIKQNIVSKIYKRSRQLKLGLLCTTTLTCIIITVILIETRQISIETFKSLSNVFYMAVLRTSTANLTLLATELYLIDRGYSFNRTREDVQEMIDTLSKKYKTVYKDLYEIDDSGFLDEYITARNQTFWEYRNGEFINRPISLMNIIKEIRLKCEILSNSDYLDIDDADFYEVYRNGYDNWFELMHDTVYILIEYTNWNAVNKFAVVKWLSVSIGVIICIMIVSIIGIPYLMLYKIRRSIWDTIFSIKRSLYINSEVKAIERLASLHSDEVEKSTTNHTASKKSIYRPHSGFFILIFLMLAMLMGLLGLVYYFNVTFIKDKLKLIDDASYYYNLTGLHRSHLYRSIFLLREISYDTLSFKEYSLSYNPHQLLEHNLNSIYKAHKDIIGVTELSSVIYDGFYKHVEDGYFSYGLYSLTLELVQSIRNIAQALKENTNYEEIGGIELETITFEYCIRMFDILIENVEKGSYAIIDSEYMNTVSSITVFMIGLVIYTVCILFSVVSYIRNIILTEFYLLTLLPIYDSNHIIGKLRGI